ncbi:hypothetical protein OCU04_003758 [Sclerotinia nivalis]|uniref:Uncharacterized protein n=1 Tax=Sclerotinia nivalis TaxID=352851 RepID=A0A9X0AW10_9HELO|nr:hypothetical protein OCU04_003758 [Sclerotinia nivalis]
MQIFKKLKNALAKAPRYRKLSDTDPEDNCKITDYQKLIMSTITIPRYDYDFEQTQEWLALYFEKVMHRSPNFSRKMAENYPGTGMGLYGLRKEDWLEMFPRPNYGFHIHSYIQCILEKEENLAIAAIPLSAYPDVLDRDFSRARLQILEYNKNTKVYTMAWFGVRNKLDTKER